jgi:hypothetical protein
MQLACQRGRREVVTHMVGSTIVLLYGREIVPDPMAWPTSTARQLQNRYRRAFWRALRLVHRDAGAAHRQDVSIIALHEAGLRYASRRAASGRRSYKPPGGPGES